MHGLGEHRSDKCVFHFKRSAVKEVTETTAKPEQRTARGARAYRVSAEAELKDYLQRNRQPDWQLWRNWGDKRLRTDGRSDNMRVRKNTRNRKTGETSGALYSVSVTFDLVLGLWLCLILVQVWFGSGLNLKCIRHIRLSKHSYTSTTFPLFDIFLRRL